jgi:hypothetical protein
MKNAEATTTENAAAVAAQGASIAPEKATSKKDASPKKNAPKAKKGVNKANAKKPVKDAAKKAPKSKSAAVPREFSKKEIILDLIRRKEGATLAELMAATSWQAHSVRGFLSGTDPATFCTPLLHG